MAYIRSSSGGGGDNFPKNACIIATGYIGGGLCYSLIDENGSITGGQLSTQNNNFKLIQDVNNYGYKVYANRTGKVKLFNYSMSGTGTETTMNVTTNQLIIEKYGKQGSTTSGQAYIQFY